MVITNMKLKYLREQKGLSQYELAPLLGLKQSTYANYEIENTQPTIETLCKIADFYGVTLDYLCDHTTEMQQKIKYLDDKSKMILELSENLSNLDKDQTIEFMNFLIQKKKVS